MQCHVSCLPQMVKVHTLISAIINNLRAKNCPTWAILCSKLNWDRPLYWRPFTMQLLGWRHGKHRRREHFECEHKLYYDVRGQDIYTTRAYNYLSDHAPQSARYPPRWIAIIIILLAIVFEPWAPTPSTHTHTHTHLQSILCPYKYATYMHSLPW